MANYYSPVGGIGLESALHIIMYRRFSLRDIFVKRCYSVPSTTLR
jgi:hypothetical protein